MKNNSPKGAPVFGNTENKKINWAVSLLALVSVPLISFQCMADIFTKPTVTVKSVRLDSVGLKSLDMTLFLNIDNPNILGVDLSKVEYVVDINNVDKVVEGTTRKEIKIAKQTKENVIEVPVSVQNSKVLPTLGSIIKSPKEINYEVEGKVHFKTFIGDIPIPFQRKSKIDNSETFDKIKKQIDSIKLFSF